MKITPYVLLAALWIPPAVFAYEPLPWSICEMIHADVSKEFELEFELYEGDFHDYVIDESGKACVIKATAPGDEFDNASDEMTRLIDALTGWEENEDYLVANDENNASTAVQRDAGVILLDIGWQVPVGKVCEKDGPIIGACGEKEDLTFFIKLQAAMK